MAVSAQFLALGFTVFPSRWDGAMDVETESSESGEDFETLRVLPYESTLGPLCAAALERGFHCEIFSGDLLGALGSVSAGANILLYLQPRDTARLAYTGSSTHRILLHFTRICLEEGERDGLD